MISVEVIHTLTTNYGLQLALVEFSQNIWRRNLANLKKTNLTMQIQGKDSSEASSSTRELYKGKVRLVSYLGCLSELICFNLVFLRINLFLGLLTCFTKVSGEKSFQILFSMLNVQVPLRPIFNEQFFHRKKVSMGQITMHYCIPVCAVCIHFQRKPFRPISFVFCKKLCKNLFLHFMLFSYVTLKVIFIVLSLINNIY